MSKAESGHGMSAKCQMPENAQITAAQLWAYLLNHACYIVYTYQYAQWCSTFKEKVLIKTNDMLNLWNATVSIIGLFTVAIFGYFLFYFLVTFQKWNPKMTWKWRRKGAFFQNGPIPPILQRASFSCSFLSSLFVVLSNSTPMPGPLHHHQHCINVQQQCLPHTSTTTTPSPPTITTPMPTPTSTNPTNCRKPTTWGPNDDRGCLGPR